MLLHVRTFLALLFSGTLLCAGPGSAGAQDGSHPVPPRSGLDTSETYPTSHFEKIVLDSAVTRPNELDVAPDGRVFYIEREGAVKVWKPETRTTEMVGFIPVKAIHTSGLLGLALDPGFAENGWIYLYYAPRGDDTRNVLARYTVRENEIDPASRTVILEVPFDRQVGCGAHSGGSLEFGPEGLLYLSAGDNTNPCDVQLSAPLDERPGREHWDAQRTSANTMSLRGKILRIRPNRTGVPSGGARKAAGGYEIPAGNLFPHGALGRPEIYTMGHRNPFRIAIDAETGCLWWGDYGPSAPGSEERGTEGLDEFNRTCEPGNFGWPYFVGPNAAFRDYDFDTGESGRYFDPDRPVNDSPNNTGARVLPPPRPALVWYPSGESEQFPLMGSGGRGPMGGAVYGYDEETVGPRGLPARYDGSFFAMEFMRGWIREMRVDEDGELEAIRPFLSEMTFLRPFDMDIGPDGSIYLIEWGENYEGWFNDRARIVRIVHRGNGTDREERTRSPSDEVRTVEEPRGRSGGGSPSSPARASLEFGSEIPLEWPLHGGIVDFDEPVPYRFSPPNGFGENAGAPTLRVQLAHDSHWHDQRIYAGPSGSFAVGSGARHLYLEDRFVRLQVGRIGDGSTGGGPDAPPEGGVKPPGRDRATAFEEARPVVLQPRRKDAVHVRSIRGARRVTTGDLRLRDSVGTFLDAGAGDRVSYGPLNLRGVHAITVRVAPDTTGRIELRVDGPEGRVLGETIVRPGGPAASGDGGAERASSGEDAGSDGASLEWRTASISVSDPGGVHDLFVLFHGPNGSEDRIVRVDWLEFEGPGMMEPAADRSPASE